jgi:hypothetical protein
MIERGFRLEDTERRGLVWEDLEQGAPTIIALAHLCCLVMGQRHGESPAPSDDGLMPEAAAILAAAGPHGSLSIRGDKSGFNPGQRLLLINIEMDEGDRLEFRGRDSEQTVRFLDGFRQLCERGLVMHQLGNEFSLTSDGFTAAKQIDRDAISELLELAAPPIR